SEPDHRGDSARHHGRHEEGRRAAAVDHRRTRCGDRQGDRAGAAGRSGAGRRQGAREVSGDWRSRAAVRRRGGGARGAVASADEFRRRMTSGPEGPALRLTARWVAGAMGAALVAGDPSQEFHGVSIDTRTLAAGDLFIAIRGERFDGAEFAEAAIGKGAAGVVVPRSWSATLRKAQGRPRQGRRAKASAARVVLEVDDPTLALQALGHAVRRESGTKVVAITGSAGKTTTKEVTAELLATRYRVVRNRGNLNNHIGLPLSLVELRQRPEIAVVELGMNHPGEIST